MSALPRRRWLRRAAALCAVVAFGAAAGAAALIVLTPMPDVAGLPVSTQVLDRDGRLLRPYAMADGRWRLPSQVGDVDPRYLKMLIAYEDGRFATHHGVDARAVMRAAWQLATHGHVVSGASTLTMQVARLLEPRRARTLAVKLREMARALRLERTLSKDEILSLYLTLAPFGGNLEGVRAASLAYFGKEPKRLSPGEAALLVALPQSPEARRPDRSTRAARAARDRVLERIARAGLLPSDEMAQAKAEPVPVGRRPMPALAPHAADQAVAAAPARRIHHLTLDAPLQRTLEELARDRAHALGPDVSVAIVAVDHASGEIVARVASADYFDARRAGQVDMTRALRSPGSALKPFIYGLGFEDGLIHPDTAIEDRPLRFGNYRPENFDMTFQGMVTVRRALQMSLNVPAVAVLDRVGASRLAARLNGAGAGLVLPPGEAPGLAMGLGGIGISLSDLTLLYAGIARGGMALPLLERRDDATGAREARRLLDPVAAWYLGQILIGTPPPDNAPRGRIAFKTGTSYGYRDAWSVGFDGARTIGVWVGRPDGAPVPGLVGRAAAAPILFDAFARSGALPAALAAAPPGALIARGTQLPLPLRQFFADPLRRDAGRNRLRIMFPPDGARLELARDGADSAVGLGGRIPLKIAGGAPPMTVLVNGVPVAAQGRRTLLVSPAGPGFTRVTVMDAHGASDSVVVRLQAGAN